MGRKGEKVPLQEIKQWIGDRKKGSTIRQIAKKYGRSLQTVVKYLKKYKSEEEIKKELKATYLLTKTGMQPENYIKRVTNQMIIEKAKSILAEELLYGDFCYNKIKKIAENLGMDTIDFLKEATVFYLKHHEEHQKLKKENKVLRTVVKKQYEFVSLETKRIRAIEVLKEIVIMYLLKGIAPPEEVYKLLMKLIIVGCKPYYNLKDLFVSTTK